jgi:hypothetical protein
MFSSGEFWLPEVCAGPTNSIRLRLSSNAFTVAWTDSLGSVKDIINESNYPQDDLWGSNNVRNHFELRLNYWGIEVYINDVFISNDTFSTPLNYSIYYISATLWAFDTFKDDVLWTSIHYDNIG